jgi:hypothetical protein
MTSCIANSRISYQHFVEQDIVLGGSINYRVQQQLHRQLDTIGDFENLQHTRRIEYILESSSSTSKTSWVGSWSEHTVSCLEQLLVFHLLSQHQPRCTLSVHVSQKERKKI